MTDVTIKTLAAERQTSVERLVQQFADAGIGSLLTTLCLHKRNRL